MVSFKKGALLSHASHCVCITEAETLHDITFPNGKHQRWMYAIGRRLRFLCSFGYGCSFVSPSLRLRGLVHRLFLFPTSNRQTAVGTHRPSVIGNNKLPSVKLPSSRCAEICRFLFAAKLHGRGVWEPCLWGRCFRVHGGAAAPFSLPCTPVG